ncbi:IS110 family transposase [Microcystis sp. M63BS1]|uniref:IS110 family transposase n=1 Tax=Microcystis sp. M63BS1 TaxID=2771205 RepID=UPI00257A84A9|nr:IS110 family transposase [Microcystis sp. M63BS1]MCA2521127.1 IS110 family transposase [Microcystis sp. M63BS1]
MKDKHDYTEKTIFVGIDVHKKTYSVAIVCDKAIVKRDTLHAIPQVLSSYLKKHFTGAKINSAYEAGFSGFGLHRHLVEYGIKNIVVHAASVEVGARDKVKNDKRDALKIAVQLEAGRLRGIFIPSHEMEDRRELTRLRSTFVQDRNRIATRFKHKAHYYGLVGPDDSEKVSVKWIEKILSKDVAPGLQYTITALAKEWCGMNVKIKELEAILQEQAKEDEGVELIYRSVKGIGKTAARILANELGDMSQFPSERDLFSYTGLTPSEYSSGEHTRKGHISRQGKPILRSTLVQCAWVAIRYDKGLKEIFERISKRAGAKRAIVAIARKLIGRIRSCFRTGEVYRSQEETSQVMTVA